MPWTRLNLYRVLVRRLRTIQVGCLGFCPGLRYGIFISVSDSGPAPWIDTGLAPWVRPVKHRLDENFLSRLR